MSIGDITFVQPWRLIAWIVILLTYCFAILKKQQGKEFYFVDLLPKQVSSIAWSWISHAIIGLIVASFTVSLAQPTVRTLKQDVTKKWIDVVVALDVSYSMQANDFSPDRISVAKDVLQQFVEKIETDRVWLVVFAWKPFTSVPLTFDYGIVGEVIERTSTSTINQNVSGMQGTAVGDALLSSLTLLEKWKEELTSDQREQREQIIILMTDGEANVWVDPVVVSWLAAESGVKVYTVWIWSLKWWYISYNTVFGKRNQQVPGVDEETLEAIAKKTNANYRRATDDQTFRRIFEEIAWLEKTEVQQENTYSYRDLSWNILVLWVLLSTILCLLWIFFPPLIEQKTLVMQRAALCALCLIGLLTYGWWSLYGEWTVQGRNVLVMLDVSTSMEVEDIAYKNTTVSRLVAAKTLIERLAQDLQWSKLWLWVFAWETVWIVPLTTTMDFVVWLLPSLDARAVTAQWTDVIKALRHGIERFDEEEWWVIVILTDGWEELSWSIGESLIIDLEKRWITLVFGHVGTKEWWPIPVGSDRVWWVVYKRYEGQTVTSSVDPAVLKPLVKQTWWTYKTIWSIDDLWDVLNSIKNQKVSLIDGVVWKWRGSSLATKAGTFAWLLLACFFIFFQTQRWQSRNDKKDS